MSSGHRDLKKAVRAHHSGGGKVSTVFLQQLKRPHIMRIGVVLGCLIWLFTVDWSEGIVLKAGDILVSDYLAGAVIRVDPVTGAQTLVSSGGNLKNPGGIAIAPSGDLFVAELGGIPGALRGIVKIEPTTGAQTVISAGGLFESLRGVLLDAGGNVLVTQGDSSVNGILQVDHSTATQTLVSVDHLFMDPSGFAMETSGELLVVDQDASSLIRVDPMTGAQSVVSSGGNFVLPIGLALNSTGHAFVTDEPANTLIRVDTVTGAQTIVSCGGFFDHPFGVAVESSGRIIVANRSPRAGIVRVDPLSGLQTQVSSGGMFQDPGFITIVPPLPDLRVIEVIIVSGAPWRPTPPGNAFVAFDVVMNGGHAPVGTSMMRYFLSRDKMLSNRDQALTGVRWVPPLGTRRLSAGATILGIPPSVPGGAYFLLACADGDHAILESNEANNCKASRWRVLILP